MFQQFPWQTTNHSLFRATDDNMLSHIGGALSRKAKRTRRKREKEEARERELALRHPSQVPEPEEGTGRAKRRRYARPSRREEEELGTTFRGTLHTPIVRPPLAPRIRVPKRRNDSIQHSRDIVKRTRRAKGPRRREGRRSNPRPPVRAADCSTTNSWYVTIAGARRKTGARLAGFLSNSTKTRTP